MEKHLKIKIIIVFLLVNINTVCSQITTNELPSSFLEKGLSQTGIVIEVTPPDMNQIKLEDDINDKKSGILQRVAVAIPIYINSATNGEWIELSDGAFLWKLTLSAENAQSLDLVFNEFWLPHESKFFVYNSHTKQSIGAITSDFIRGSKKSPADFSTGIILGDEITLEYYQPEYVKEKPIISISKIYYGYRYVDKFNTKDFGDAAGCNKNINCPEGQNWQKEKKAIARIYIKTPTASGWCSGALINNTANSLEPLFLTANHCLGGVFDAINNPNMSQWIFYWDYEFIGCLNSSYEPTIKSTVGAVVKANNEVSDFAILELIQDPRNLPNFIPYYLGWDKSGNAGTGGVGIHHPKGDVKKISIDNDPLINYTSNINWYGGSVSQPGTHWKSIIDVGTQEGGSSGSPILNNQHKVIGQLHGGQSGCAPVVKYYGKFNVSWTGNDASDNRRRLDHWLDPNNTGVNTINGQSPFAISGPEIVCSFSNTTYTINNLPTGATVNWSDSRTLKVIDGQGTSSAVYQSTKNGAACINSVITLSTGETINLIKWIYVGTRPPAILLCPAADYPNFNTHLQYGYVNEDYYLYAYGTALSNNDADYKWRFYSSDPFTLPVLGSGRQIEYKKYIAGDYKVSLQYDGVCGWSDETFRTIRIEDNVMFSLSMYPNPTTEETALSIESDRAMTFDEDEFWDVEIYSSSMILKTKKNKIKGKEIKIKTTGWKTGIYFVRVKYKDLILEDKLIIK